MELKTHCIILNLFISSSIFSMEMDKATLLELIQNQKDVVEECKGIDPNNNKCLALCLDISESCPSCLLKKLNQEAVKVKIEALEDYLEKQQSYQDTLECAQSVEDDPNDFNEVEANRQWKRWHSTCKELMNNKLIEKRILNPISNYSISNFVNEHANITEEQSQYLLAKFFVTMKLREKQRKLTKRYLSPLRARTVK